MKTYNSLSDIRHDLAADLLNISDLVEYYLDRIEKQRHLNAFLEVFTEDARKAALEVQSKLKAGTAGRLAGMVVGIKDNLCYKGHKVSASSRILENFESLFTATAVQRLLDEDAIIIGRLNCDEFAMGSSNENSYYGNVLNPLDQSRVPGGSSGGSAAAVAADLCLATLGSDTGGSIRQPASFTGTIGLKPTYGRVSRYGLLAYASSFDQIGPFTRSVEDAAILMEVMSGEDGKDATLSSREVPAYTKSLKERKPYRMVYIKDCIQNEGLSSEVKKSFLEKIEEFKAAGHHVEGVDFPYLDYLVPTYYVLTTAEASSNLSRYDGIHFGYRSTSALGIDDTYRKSRSEGFGKEVKRRIMLGTFVLSAGFYDAYYGKAQRVRRLIKEKTEAMLADADFILTPTTPDVAFKFGEKGDDPVAMYLEDIFTVQANLAGIPAISLPLGKRAADALPFGLQIMAKRFDEAKLLSFSDELMN